MFKKIISVIGVTVMLTASSAIVSNGQSLFVNGTELECYNEKGITYVSVRAFAEQYENYEVKWHPKEKTATVEGNGLEARIYQDREYTLANGRVLMRNGINRNKKGRVYAPVTVLCEAVDANYSWNNSSKTVTVTGGGSALAPSESFYDSEELYWLSRIISAESRGESLMGKCAVGNVVMNRVKSGLFPDTVKQVIFDTKYGVQFSPISDNSIYDEPTEESVLAAKAVLDGFVKNAEILYFFNPRTAQSSWIQNNRAFAFSLGNHDFYY